MRIYELFLLSLATLAVSGCVGGARTVGSSHPASAGAAPTPLPPVARAITHEDDVTPTTQDHAHHGHGHAGHTMPSAAEHAHE